APAADRRSPSPPSPRSTAAARSAAGRSRDFAAAARSPRQANSRSERRLDLRGILTAACEQVARGDEEDDGHHQDFYRVADNGEEGGAGRDPDRLRDAEEHVGGGRDAPLNLARAASLVRGRERDDGPHDA